MESVAWMKGGRRNKNIVQMHHCKVGKVEQGSILVRRVASQ